MIQNKVYALLGLAMKAGSVVSGEVACENAVKGMKAKLVIVAMDASAGTKKLFSNKTQYYEIPYAEYGTKDELGHALGKDMRSSIAVCDVGFADAIYKKLELSENKTEEN